jgi:hypothetical protein
LAAFRNLNLKGVAPEGNMISVEGLKTPARKTPARAQCVIAYTM